MSDKASLIKYNRNQYYKKTYAEKLKLNHYRALRKIDTISKIINNLNGRINVIFKNKNIKRKFTYGKYLGCSPIEFKLYLSSQFKEKMDFDNYGKWEVDHIKPISLFNLNDEEEVFKCFNYQNLQPLWKLENRQKSNKYIEKELSQ